jgi:hypothetical protein
MIHIAAMPSRRKASTAVMIGMPWNDCIASKSSSPETMASARAATAHSITGRSSLSRSSGGSGSTGVEAMMTLSASFLESWSGVVARPVKRGRNFGREMTSANSASNSGDDTNATRPLSTTSSSRAGGPSHREPEIRTLVSTTSFTRAPFRPDDVHLALDFLRCERLARLGANGADDFEIIPLIRARAQLTRDQAGYVLRIQQALRPGLSRHGFRQIKLYGDAHGVASMAAPNCHCQTGRRRQGRSPGSDHVTVEVVGLRDQNLGTMEIGARPGFFRLKKP